MSHAVKEITVTAFSLSLALQAVAGQGEAVGARAECKSKPGVYVCTRSKTASPDDSKQQAIPPFTSHCHGRFSHLLYSVMYTLYASYSSFINLLIN